MVGRTPVLTMIQGHEPGARWKLRETRVTTVGRSSKNQISLVSPTVSRFHCEISYVNGLWYITDLNSRKGTYLNGAAIVQREVLHAGAIVRLSTNVFRFELLDEKAGEDDGLLAIQEASLDQEIGRKGESRASLEAIRLRSQLADVPDEAGEPAHRRRVAASALFVGAVATVLALTVGGSLALAYGRRARTLADTDRWAQEAARALASALALAQEGEEKQMEALEALRGVVEGHPGTPQAQEAAELYRQTEAGWFGSELAQITRSEAGGDYADALRRCERLLELISDPDLLDLAGERQHYSERLARAAYGRIAQQAEGHVQQGNTSAALALYEQALETIGLAELVEAARARIQEIKEGKGAQGFIQPGPGAGITGYLSIGTERPAQS